MDLYLGEIRAVSWSRIPRGWLACDGQTLEISKYAALYSVIGSTYGGDNKTYFKLPNLCGRAIMGTTPGSQSIPMGSTGGITNVALNNTQAPKHNHDFQVCTTAGTAATPAGNIYAGVATGQYLYGPLTGNTTAISSTVLNPAGKSAPHTNMQPYLPLTYIICTIGLYPTSP